MRGFLRYLFLCPWFFAGVLLLGAVESNFSVVDSFLFRFLWFQVEIFWFLSDLFVIILDCWLYLFAFMEYVRFDAFVLFLVLLVCLIVASSSWDSRSLQFFPLCWLSRSNNYFFMRFVCNDFIFLNFNTRYFKKFSRLQMHVAMICSWFCSSKALLFWYRFNWERVSVICYLLPWQHRYCQCFNCLLR